MVPATESDDGSDSMTDLLRERLVTPSILSADFGRLGADIACVIDAGARLIHVDVMDGHFVPNITIGAPVVKAVAPAVHERGGALDVHLMIERPERFIGDFAAAGADAITVHQEACVHLHRTLAQIREAGAAAGVALNPATPLETLAEVRDLVDLVLVMSVNPGFGGQRFIAGALDKLRRARSSLPADVTIEVDGGVSLANAAELVRCGANLLVAGNSVYGAADPAAAFRELAAAVSAA
jgi:ribulose-phosphate 3-epimerase